MGRESGAGPVEGMSNNTLTGQHPDGLWLWIVTVVNRRHME